MKAAAYTKALEQIVTARLQLRRPMLEDVAAIFATYASDKEVTRYLSWPCHRQLADTRAFIDFSTREWQQNPAGPYLLVLPNGQVIGSTGIAFEAGIATTGYVLAKPYWGCGYATEALSAMLALARQLGLPQLYADCHPQHHASLRVLRKGGFIVMEQITRSHAFPNLDTLDESVLRLVNSLRR